MYEQFAFFILLKF